MTRACLGGVGAKPMVVRTRRVRRGRPGRGLRSLCCVVHWPGVGAAGARGRLEAPQESRDSGGLPHGSRRACSGTTTVAGRRPPTEATPWPVGDLSARPTPPPSPLRPLAPEPRPPARGAPPPGPRRASGVHAARWGASQAGIAPSHAPPRRAPQGAERLLALRPAAAGAIGEPQPALGPQGVLAAVALGASRRCAPWDALGTRPGRAADGEERPGPGLPARGYDDQAQGASNLSPSPLLKHYPRNLQAQPGTVGILRLEEGHRADVTIYDLKTLQPYPALTIRLQ